jgi:DNA-directed RNA polymerase specialized sigma24 family protein
VSHTPRNDCNRLAAAAAAGDEQAFEKFLELAMPIARGVHRKYWLTPPPGYDRDDIEQLAKIAVWESLAKWDPEKSDSISFALVTIYGNLGTLYRVSNRIKRKGVWNTFAKDPSHEAFEIIDPQDDFAKVEQALYLDQIVSELPLSPLQLKMVAAIRDNPGVLMRHLQSLTGLNNRALDNAIQAVKHKAVAAGLRTL